jgi:hypothetical protein
MAMAPAYPLRVEADLEPQLSRWLWLVKWFLAIPHFFVLAFLWLAAAVLTVVAWFAILFTGRYPRSIFEFNVGVLRWSWRVADYAFGVLATDRYPPFTLGEVADYPAHLDVTYPEHLSRGLVLVKWFLAIPHLIIVAIFAGGGSWVAWNVGRTNVAVWGSLIGLLATIAVVILAFTGTYPRSLFDLILGLNRWVYRVYAYVGLMTDRYPPFRLDLGGGEPGSVLTMPPEGGPAPTPATPERPDVGEERPTPSGPAWTGGRITSLVIGSILALVSVGLIGAGGFGLWADLDQRDAAGYVTSPEQTFSTITYALTTDRLQLWAGTPTWTYPSSVLGEVRIRFTPLRSTPVFAGIAATADVDRYLAGTGHAVVRDIGGRPSYRVVAGSAPAAGPGDQGFWVASSEGLGTQTVTWTPQAGSWTVVVMNADGQAGVAVRADIGATIPHLLWFALGVLLAGLVVLAGALAMIVIPVQRASRAGRGNAR